VHNIISYIFMKFGILLQEHKSQKVQWDMWGVKESDFLTKQQQQQLQQQQQQQQ
jgi:hypothetical protein